MPKFFFIIVIVFCSFLPINARKFNQSTNGSDEAPINHAIPEKKILFSDPEIGNAFQTPGIIGQPDKENSGSVFCEYRRPMVFNQKKPVTNSFFFIAGERITSRADHKIMNKMKVKKSD